MEVGKLLPMFLSRVFIEMLITVTGVLYLFYIFEITLFIIKTLEFQA